MDELFVKVENDMGIGKSMNNDLMCHARRHITIIEDDKALNDGIVLALKNTEFTFTQNYSLGQLPRPTADALEVGACNCPVV